MANIEVQIPTELSLTKKQKDALQKAFQAQLVETLGNTAAIAKSKLMVVDVRAKSKNEVV